MKQGQVKVNLRMIATISGGHRVSDGAEAVQPQVQVLAGFLENPVRMLV